MMKAYFKKLPVQILSLILIALISFFALSRLTTSQSLCKPIISSLDEKQTTVIEMAAVSTATATALAAIPGDATTPVANKLADVSEYLLIVMCIILLEKYLVTLTGLLSFKILIPIACGLLIAFCVSRRTAFQALAARLIAFSLIIVLVIPASVGVSNIIDSTHELSAAASLEQAQEDQEEIEDKTSDENFIEKITSSVSESVTSLIKKGENMLRDFMETIAVLLVTNLALPVLTLLLFVWLLKSFWGINPMTLTEKTQGGRSQGKSATKKEIPEN